MTTSFDQNVIRDSNFEGGTRLLETGGPSGGALGLTIANTRWDIASLHTDNRGIIYQFKGPLVLLNTVFQSPSANKPLEIYMNMFSNVGSLTAIGNYFASTLATPFTGTPPAFSAGNLIDRNDGNGAVVLPNTLPIGPLTGTIQGGATVVNPGAVGSAARHRCNHRQF